MRSRRKVRTLGNRTGVRPSCCDQTPGTHSVAYWALARRVRFEVQRPGAAQASTRISMTTRIRRVLAEVDACVDLGLSNRTMAASRVNTGERLCSCPAPTCLPFFPFRQSRRSELSPFSRLWLFVFVECSLLTYRPLLRFPNRMQRAIYSET